MAAREQSPVPVGGSGQHLPGRCAVCPALLLPTLNTLGTTEHKLASSGLSRAQTRAQGDAAAVLQPCPSDMARVSCLWSHLAAFLTGSQVRGCGSSLVGRPEGPEAQPALQALPDSAPSTGMVAPLSLSHSAAAASFAFRHSQSSLEGHDVLWFCALPIPV